MRTTSLWLPLIAAHLLIASIASAAVNINWVTIGDPGNAPDITGYGAVNYEYQISKHEVTNTQYAEFLNAVAADDPNGLYNPNMDKDITIHGGIKRTGSPGSYTYSVQGHPGRPVVYISLYDAMRFANWLHNGQPVGPQGNATTEDGAYTITAARIATNSITRNPGATIVLTSEDEWYKAAYYEAMSASYNPYPFANGLTPFCSGADETPPNGANCDGQTKPDGVNPNFSPVGFYLNAESAYGTFDQAGNAEEWTETAFNTTSQVVRGGAFNLSETYAAASTRHQSNPSAEINRIGFRVASITPALEPSDCSNKTDAEIWSLVDTLRAAGAAISIDGNDADWTGFPSFPDPPDDLIGNPGQEMVAGSIAPLADRIKLLAYTAGTPPQTDNAFGVQLDLLNGPPADVQILIGATSGVHTVILFDDTNQPILPPAGTISDPALQVAFGPDFIELEIPYSVLLPFLPALGLPNQRSWARAGVASLDALGTIIDFGAGGTSYRLVPTPFALDPPLPSTPRSPISLELPLAGRWFISQGPFGDFSHYDYRAYDFNVVDHSFQSSPTPNSTNNSDYFAFGEPITSPTDGTVTQAVGSNPDVTPPVPNPLALPNLVEIDIGGGIDVNMLHMKQGTVTVSAPQAVSVGDPLGEVGNSGFSTGPHLHLEVNEPGFALAASDRGTELSNVRVSLNPVENDPWARDCPTWEPREGYFVEEAQCGDGIDNDGDGWVDLGDPGCTSGGDMDEHDPGLPCDDGADNDGDGFADLADPGCNNPLSYTESPQCDDDLDNDGDGQIDWNGPGLPDPECGGRPWLDNEAKPLGCGLGFELTLLLPPLIWLRDRRRRPSV